MDKQQPQQDNPKKQLAATTLIYPFIGDSAGRKKTNNTIMTPISLTEKETTALERGHFFGWKDTCSALRPTKKTCEKINHNKAPRVVVCRTEPPCPPDRPSSRRVLHLEVLPTFALHRSHLTEKFNEWTTDRLVAIAISKWKWFLVWC